MALRVLLADESTTIKKVMQLTLQDFGVDVKSVPVGTDVLEVAQEFQPHIVFADVLLAKKSGYEVSLQLKQNSALKSIPIVLMWSGFMDIDEAKAQESHCDARLEKPFDADYLRNLVKKLVPALSENTISDYLSFNHLPEIEEFKNEKFQAPTVDEPLESSDPVLMKMEEDEEFQQVPLPKLRDLSNEIQEKTAQLKQERPLQSARAAARTTSPSAHDKKDDLSSSSVAWYGSEKETSFAELSQMNQATGAAALAADTESKNKLEQAIKAQARQVLEEIVWKILPDVCERVVREELSKLMKDAERFP